MPKKSTYIPSVYAPQDSKKLSEALKSEVESNNKLNLQLPKEVGEQHPFEFKLCENAYNSFGITKAAVDKHIDFMISPGFYVKSDNKKSEILLNKFNQKENFDQVIREFAYEGLKKGNAFMELAIDKKSIKVRVTNANNMYIQRDQNGNVIRFNQYIGGLGKFEPDKLIPFETNEMAHWKPDATADKAYGVGMIYPSLYVIDNLLKSEKDMHTIIGRKANAPIHAKLGSIEEPVSAADVAAFGGKLEYLNNLHEWATDHRVEFKVIDFGNLAEKFATVLEHDRDLLFYIYQVPSVLMGTGSVPEGLAKVQMDAFERRIQSLQASLSKVLEEKIYRPILEMNGLDGSIEIEWGLPSEDSINQRISQITMLLNNINLSPELRAMLERDIATNLDHDEELDLLTTPQEAEAKARERQKEEAIKQPEIPGEKEKAHTHIHEDLNKDFSLKEWLNFDYMNYKKEILDFIQKDKFEDLAGRNKKDYDLGLLTPKEVAKLRATMYDGFNNEKSILQISKDISELNLKARYIINDNGQKVMQISKEERPIMIARTESTRAGAEGILRHYEKQGVEKVRWVASISDRTCPICQEMNGQVFNINESSGMIPAHVMCRCSFLAIQE